MADVVIRRWGDGDLASLKALRLRSLKVDPDNFASDYEDWAAKSDDEWRIYLEEPGFLAFDGARPLGLMGLILETKSRMAHRAGLGMVWVEPEERGRGVADALLAACLEEARRRGIIQVELSVNAENARAVRFYERAGFTVYGRLPRGFRTQRGYVDDLLMVRPLDA